MVLKGTIKGSKGTLGNLFRFPVHTTEPLRFPTSGTFFEGSRARVPYTGQQRTLLAPFFLRVYSICSSFSNIQVTRDDTLYPVSNTKQELSLTRG